MHIGLYLSPIQLNHVFIAINIHNKWQNSDLKIVLPSISVVIAMDFNKLSVVHLPITKWAHIENSSFIECSGSCDMSICFSCFIQLDSIFSPQKSLDGCQLSTQSLYSSVEQWIKISVWCTEWMHCSHLNLELVDQYHYWKSIAISMFVS